MQQRRAPVKVKNDTDAKPDMQQAQIDDELNEIRQWSWLGNRSPLVRIFEFHISSFDMCIEACLGSTYPIDMFQGSSCTLK